MKSPIFKNQLKLHVHISSLIFFSLDIVLSARTQEFSLRWHSRHSQVKLIDSTDNDSLHLKFSSGTSIAFGLSVCPSVCMCGCQSVCLHVCPSVCMCGCQSVCLYGCLSVSLFVRQSVCMSVRLSVCVDVSPYVCMYVRLSVCMSVCLSVRLSACLSVCPHLRPSAISLVL